MIMKKLITFCLFFIICSCGNLDFVYEDGNSGINPIYGKTTISISGSELPFLNTKLLSYFGKSENPEHSLDIIINETKTKRSVETNQTISTLRYDIKFTYILV